MVYNKKDEFPRYMQTAGKVSVLAAVAGLAVFIFAFIVDVGQQELQKVSAQQTASTSLTVLNTPPTFVVFPYEVTPSSTTTPTNSGDVISWSAIGNDANGADYYLLVCSTNASPTPQNGGAPSCGGGIQWGVSTATLSDTLAVVSTTTVELADNAGTQFAESNDWYAWVCDGDPTQAECSVVPSQGLYATSSSPFNMNQRPVLTSADPLGAVDPGGLLTFNTVSTDPDVVDAADQLFITVCRNPGDYNTVTNECDSNFIASSSVPVTANVTATVTVAAILQDGIYDAEVFLRDEHGHEASANPDAADFTVNNVAPTVNNAQIILNGGTDMSPSDAAAETTGFTLDFTINDANSCQNTTNVPGSEIPDFGVAIYRSSIGTTSPTGCNPDLGTYDPNFCYESSQATTTWNLVCTASSTSCTGSSDDTLLYECTFPLWFLTDPTDFGPFAADDWRAAVAGIDDQLASSTLTTSASGVEVIQFPAINLTTAVIPYGGLAPGDDTGTLSTTTQIENVGNTGVDQEVSGSAMCPPFVSTSTDCSLNGTSTVFTSSQQFASSSGVVYGSAAAVELTTTTVSREVELDTNKTTATSTFELGTTYWGIGVPSAVTVAGSYTGLNNFSVTVAEDADW